MNSIWNNLYDRAKDRRYGTLFFISFFGSFGLFLVGVLGYKILDGVDFSQFDLPQYFLQLLPGVVIIMVALALRSYRRARAQGGHKFRRQELSRDEISKARSKLMNRNKL
jgi:hypothetical protein